MSWSQDQIILFLELYQAEPALWDPKIKEYKDRKKVYDAWMRLENLLNLPVDELKKKRDSLLATYRSYRRKVQASLKSGAGAEDVYRPVWFAYDLMDQFLGSTLKCKSTINTVQEEEEAEVMNETSNISIDLNESIQNANTSQNTSEPEMSELEPKKTIRRRYNPPEVQQAGRQMTEAFNTLNNVINRRTTEVEDECDIFGKLIAKKLKKLPENKREDMMFEILSLFRSTNNSMPRPPSTDSYRSSTPELSTSIYNPREIHSSYNVKRPRSQNFTYAPAMVLSQKSPSSFSEPENRTTVSRSTLNTSYSLPAIPGSNISSNSYPRSI